MQATLPLAATKPLPCGAPAARVRSVDDLRRALRVAFEAAPSLDDSGLDRVLCFDAGRGLVEVQAALGWPALAEFLCAQDAAFGALDGDATVPGRSIGAALAVNAPGPDGLPVVAHLESLTVVTPDGELRRASRSVNAELFALAIGGQGLFGILYSATLRVASLRKSLASAQRPACIQLACDPVGRVIDLELLVPPSALERLLAELRSRLEDWRLAAHGMEVRRTLPESDTVLRWAQHEYASLRILLAAPATIGGRVRLAQFERSAIDLAIANGGTFPIATIRNATRVQLETCYPDLRTFMAEKRRYDPLERLQNEWYRHHYALLRNDPSALRWSA